MQDIKNKCAALLEAVGEVPQLAEQFVQQMEADLADQKDRDRRRKERMAAEQREKEARGDFSGDAGAGQRAAKPEPSKAKEATEAKANGGYPDAKAAAHAKQAPEAKKPDPFADFDFNEPRKPAVPRAAPKSEAVVVKKEDDRGTIQAAVKQKRTCWDAAFDHPYAGALKSNGTGIYCRPCQRWIVTYELLGKV